MKTIVFKKDIVRFLKNFKKVSSYDHQGEKEYFVFADGQRKGRWTLMYYRDQDLWTIHGIGENYCDEGETTMEKEELIDFIYRNRKSINNSIRELKSA